MDYFDKFKKIAEDGIEQAEEEVVDYYEDRSQIDVYNKIEKARQEELEKILLSHGKAIKSLRITYPDDCKAIFDRNKKERKEPYPFGWMLKDHKEKFIQYQYINPLLNYLLNRNRYWRISNKARFDSMTAECDLITGGNRVGRNKDPYSSFTATNRFYETTAVDLGCSASLVKKYIKAFERSQFIYRLGEVPNKRKGRNPILYADGYFNDFKKVMFFKESEKYHRMLREFKII